MLKYNIFSKWDKDYIQAFKNRSYKAKHIILILLDYLHYLNY